MFCPRCGAQNPDDARFCTGCGYKFSNDLPYAGFWRRLAAFLIDNIILGIVGVVVGIVVGIVIYFIYDVEEYNSGGVRILSTIISFVLSCLLSWLYYAFMESSSLQATPGKMALRIIVTDLNGNRITFWKATARYCSKGISTMLLFIGYIMAAFTEKKQALHDLAAGTLVVKKK